MHSHFGRYAASLIALLVLTLSPACRSDAAESLTIGSKAPALDIEHWVQNGNGKYQEVKEFSPGKVYIVEFWATWCGPCVASMPHLAQLQKDNSEKGVQIVSISDEDLETVERFLSRDFKPAKPDEDSPKTYRELTSAYCLTTDPDQSSYNDYMVAAKQSGIPTAFIVGKKGLIEWIGHPMEIDEPLRQVIADKWDRQAFKEEIEARQAEERAMSEIFALLNQNKFDEALEKIDAIKNSGKNLQLQLLKLQVLVAAEKNDAAAQHLEKTFKALSDQADVTDMVAWNVYQMAVDKRFPSNSFAETAVKAAKAALPKAKEKVLKASLMDTLAHLLEHLEQIDEAIAYETKAIPIADPSVADAMKEYLQELMDKKQ